MEVLVMGFLIGYGLSLVFIGIGYYIGINVRIEEAEEKECV